MEDFCTYSAYSLYFSLSLSIHLSLCDRAGAQTALAHIFQTSLLSRLVSSRLFISSDRLNIIIFRDMQS